MNNFYFRFTSGFGMVEFEVKNNRVFGIAWDDETGEPIGDWGLTWPNIPDGSLFADVLPALEAFRADLDWGDDINPKYTVTHAHQVSLYNWPECDTGLQHGPELPPPCPKCDDSGYTGPFDGGYTTDYCCDCTVGERQFEIEIATYKPQTARHRKGRRNLPGKGSLYGGSSRSQLGYAHHDYD